MKRLLMTVIVCVAACFMSSCRTGATFTLWQLPSQADDHGSSYVIRTQHGRIVVVDGGKGAETDYLRGFLAALGNEVDIWMVTHPHYDHVEAMTNLLRDRQGLQVHKICQSRFTPAMIATDGGFSRWAEEYYSVSDSAEDIIKQECYAGDEFSVDGVRFKILSNINPEITENVYNNSSMVFRVWDHRKSVVFLGDLGVEGGDKLLASPYRADLDCDYLQLAHHGQNGCSENFYKSIKFRACLWPTATWLYNNDTGGGVNTAEYASFDTRRWMDEIGIKEHYVSCDGLQRID